MARDAGAVVLLLGHTADDVLEAHEMRAGGVRVPAPRAWSPAPLWPQGRDLFVLRPLLGVRRAALRAWLVAQGEAWVEDPANEDLRSPRARARAALAKGPEARAPVLDSPDTCTLPAAIGPAGDIRMSLSHLRAAPGRGRAWLGRALVCVGGGDRPPAGAVLDRMLAWTLGTRPWRGAVRGVRVLSDGAWLHLVRETQDRRTGVPPQLPLGPDQTLVWDGRFEVHAQVDRVWLGPLEGHLRHLAPPLRAAVSRVPAAARPGLPCLIKATGEALAPTLVPVAGVEVRNLVAPRLAAHLGAIQNESDAIAWKNASDALKCRFHE